MSNYSKSDLASAVAGKTGLTKSDALRVIDATLDEISAQPEAGLTVNLPGFGRFAVKERPARPGRNPATGEAIEIAASRSLGFRPSKTRS